MPLQRVHRRARRLLGAGVDQIGDRFGLRQIELVVEKRAFGELAGPGDAHVGQRQHALEQQIEDHRPAVALQFQHVFAGKGVRPREPQRDALIEGGAGSVAERQIVSVARLRQLAEQRLATSLALLPEMRRMPTPPRPGGVAWATMVSVVLITVLSDD